MKNQPLRRVGTLLSLLLVATTLGACVIIIDENGNHRMPWQHRSVRGSGHRVEETRSVPAYTNVEIEAAANVVVYVGNETSMRLSGDDNLLAHISTHVEGDTLHIRSEGNLQFVSELQISLGTPNLQRFQVDGAGDVEIHDAHGEGLQLAIEGSGDIHATGFVERLVASIEGSGDLRLDNLSAESAEIRISGSGSVLVNVSNALHYSISGSGSIAYYGTPTVSGSIEGSGDVGPAR